MPLQSNQRTKLDSTDDTLFYDYPRFVTHVDEGFIQQLTDLYRDCLKPNTRIFDMMSSWVSHLPDEMEFEHVEGHGLNAEELARNPRLNHYFLQDLNQNQTFPLPDQSFDAVLNTVSIQYLQYPEAVFKEIHRILKPSGIVIISFSNRMFFQKAIQAWREGSEADRVELVKRYFESVPGFDPSARAFQGEGLSAARLRPSARAQVEGSPNAQPKGFSTPDVITRQSQPSASGFLQWLSMGTSDPFYAVIAHRLTES